MEAWRGEFQRETKTLLGLLTWGFELWICRSEVFVLLGQGTLVSRIENTIMGNKRPVSKKWNLRSTSLGSAHRAMVQRGTKLHPKLAVELAMGKSPTWYSFSGMRMNIADGKASWKTPEALCRERPGETIREEEVSVVVKTSGLKRS